MHKLVFSSNTQRTHTHTHTHTHTYTSRTRKKSPRAARSYPGENIFPDIPKNCLEFHIFKFYENFLKIENNHRIWEVMGKIFKNLKTLTTND